MDSAAPDRELVSTYAREGSEAAFRALVARHVNLVFAAAFRQVGDSGVAEEVTQNVFVALARKAPRLAGHETLAGWLHRTAILEAKARIRAELRRRRREETAAALATLHLEGAAAADDLTPLLDEALLNLRETDRLALVLRFLEERSLREVGSVLGVDEDAARKRVSRALDRVTDFFRARGFAIPVAGGAPLLAQAVKAAPAGLAASASNAGLAAGGAAGGFNLVLLHLMALTKTQTAVVCALLVAAPLTWQWRVHSNIQQSQTGLTSQLAEAQTTLADADAEETRLRNALVRAQADAFNAGNRLAALQARRAGTTSPPPYRWDDSLPVARVPKELLRQMPLEGVANKRGELTSQIKSALQLTDSEAAAVQGAIGRLLAGYHAAQAAALKPVETTERDLFGRKPEEVRVFEINGMKDTVAQLRQDFFTELGGVLDPERLSLFTKSLRNWMPLDEEERGINSGMAILSNDHRLRFFNYSGQTEGEPFLGWGFSEKGGSLSATMPVSEIPEFLKPHLQDWIDQVLADRAAEAQRAAAAKIENP